MDHISTPIFQAIFQSDIPRIILRANPPYFTILDYNNAHVVIVGNITDDDRGKGFFERYPSNLVGASDLSDLKVAFEQAILKNRAVNLAPFKQVSDSDRSSGLADRWWQMEILPVVKETDQVAYLLVTTSDVTRVVQSELREQELTEELVAANEELSAANEELSTALEDLQATYIRLETLNQTLEERIASRVKALADSESSLRGLVMAAHYPLMILRGRNWVIEIANQPLVNLWDKTIEEVNGKELLYILPEIKDQPFPGFLRQVYETGIGYGEEERIFHYNSPDGPATKYVSFYYDPLRNDAGEVCGVIVAADDITAKVKQRLLLEESLRKEQALSEEFITLNEELAATVEELSAANEEMMRSQEELSHKNEELIASETRFRNLIRQAPVSICIIRANDLMIQEVNDGYLELVGKKREELENHTIWDAVSEAADAYGPVLNQVISTGEPFVAKEHEVVLIRFGKPDTVHVDFVYEPVFDGIGKVVAIMVVAIEVTDKVSARKSIEDIEQRIRLAVESAEIGTFEFNYMSGLLTTSERFDVIFGTPGPSSRGTVLSRFHPDDIHLSAAAHQRAKVEGTMTYEARLLQAEDAIRWVRVQAKAFFDQNGQVEKLLGTVLDITEFKRLQQQKDDFLSIASHELKTPITSLKASLQLLKRMKDAPNPAMLPRLIEQSSRSMDKISSLVEDLLNVSRMNQTEMSLNKTTFNVKQLLDDCCAHIRESGVHELIFEGESTLEVFADQHRIDQVVVNLVNNAAKYAPNSRKIFLGAERSGEAVKISVRDTGPGIPEEAQKHIFDRYYRADNSGHHVSGLGLGLYISADIVRRHQGEMGVHSVPGEGATFWFTLPLHGLS